MLSSKVRRGKVTTSKYKCSLTNAQVLAFGLRLDRILAAPWKPLEDSQDGQGVFVKSLQTNTDL